MTVEQLLDRKKIWLFDFDGTLVDSMGMWGRVDVTIMQRHGAPVPEGFLDMLVPLSEEATAQCFLDHGCQGTVQSILQEISELADAEYATSIPLKPGARALLDGLRGRGVKLGLVTAATLVRILPCLERHGLSKYFDLILSCDSVGIPKSDPRIYRMALERLDGRAEDAVLLDDNITALRVAASAGLATVGVYDEHSDRHWEDIKREVTAALRSFESVSIGW